MCMLKTFLKEHTSQIFLELTILNLVIIGKEFSSCSLKGGGGQNRVKIGPCILLLNAP